jgi:hypothetical protein
VYVCADVHMDMMNTAILAGVGQHVQHQTPKVYGCMGVCVCVCVCVCGCVHGYGKAPKYVCTCAGVYMDMMRRRSMCVP